MFAGRKLMLAVSILHDRGWQKLRLEAGLSPSGGHWRYALAAQGSQVSGTHGSLTNQKSFSWGDTDESTPEQLADVIAEKFPDLLAAAHGSDADYAAWLKMIIEESQPDGLFIELWDSYDGPCDHVRLINCDSKKKYPQPPAGE